MFARISNAAALASLALVSAIATARADEPKKLNYKDDVSGVFQARCYACHNNDKKKGGLVLDNFASLMQGGASGAVVEPGDPDNSRLYLLVAHEEEPTMPPNSPKIPDAEIAMIRDWIAAGAPETSGSTVVMKEKPKVEFKIDPASIGKPQGEPAMPQGISTDPIVLSARPPAILALSASPWAPLVAVAGHHQVLLYNTQTFRLVGVLPFPEGVVASLKFTTDGELLLAGGGRGGQSGRVIVWNVKTGERLFEVGKEYDTVLAADISPDRSLVALGGPSKMLRVYNTSDGELVYESKKHTEWVTAVAFSPDGVLLASGDRNGGLSVWEGQTGREFYDLRGHQAMITDVSWRLDSNVLASSSEDGGIRLWEMQNGNNIKTWGAHGGGALSVRFAKDGRLVSTGRDRVAKIWDQNGGAQRQFEPFSDVALQAVFTHDDAAVVAGDFAGEVRLYELTEGKQIGQLAANPEPVATRLEKLGQALAQARVEADAATKELAALQAGVASQGEAITQAQAALDAATLAANTAKATLDAAEAAAKQNSDAEREAAKAYSAVDFAKSQSSALREAAFRDLRAKEAAAREATAVASKSGMPRDLTVADDAVRVLAACTAELEANLPAWSAAIEAWGPARQAHDRAEIVRLASEVRLPILRQASSTTGAEVPPRQQALAAVQAAKASAEKALAEKAPAVHASVAKAATIQSEVDALTAEVQKAAEAKATALAPSASNP